MKELLFSIRSIGTDNLLCCWRSTRELTLVLLVAITIISILWNRSINSHICVLPLALLLSIRLMLFEILKVCTFLNVCISFELFVCLIIYFFSAIFSRRKLDVLVLLSLVNVFLLTFLTTLWVFLNYRSNFQSPKKIVSRQSQSKYEWIWWESSKILFWLMKKKQIRKTNSLNLEHSI